MKFLPRLPSTITLRASHKEKRKISLTQSTIESRDRIYVYYLDRGKHRDEVILNLFA